MNIGSSARAKSATDLFLALTPERVLAAVEAAGFRCRPVCYPLNSFENRVYEVELEERDDRGHIRRIAKFYRPGRWTAEQIGEEHAFLAELVAEEIPVCPPLPFSDGSTLREIDGILYCLFERRGGRNPDELSDRDVLRLGRFVARMHNVAARRPAPSRLRLDAETYIRREVRWLESYRGAGRPPRSLLERWASAARHLADLADAEMEGVDVHRLHGDLHLGNVLFRDSQLRVYDFDDMLAGPAVQDLWLAVPGRDLDAHRQRHLFLEGYEDLRFFDRSTLRLIEPLRGLRMVRYTAWLARRWHDPAFRAGWPHFGNEDFWHRETEDLEEQLAAVRDAARSESAQVLVGASAPAPPTEELLSNRDYFWDWDDEAGSGAGS